MRMRVLVLGGKGFIGSSIIEYLKAQGAQVSIGSRNKWGESDLVTLQMQEMKQISDWLPLLNNVNVLVNAVGILRERKGESYDVIHHVAVASLATACAQLDVKLVHVSAIGLNSQAKSGFIRSKYLGEQAILNSKANAVIVRASLLDGEGGYGAKWFRRVANWPVQFVMQSKGLVAPLQVSDLGEAIANLVMHQLDTPNIIELGGNEISSIPNYLQLLRQARGRGKSLQISVPKCLVRLASHVFDVLAWTPLSFGHYELMQGYNVPAVNLLPELLCRKPTNVGISIEGAGINRLPNEREVFALLNI